MAILRPRDRLPLITYLRVQEAFERDLLNVLRRSAADAEKQLLAIAGRDGIGAAIRADQIRLAKRAILAQQAELWRTIGSNVMATRQDAAAAAVRVNFAYTSMLLRSGLSNAEILRLQTAAEAQARRGIENAISRMQGMSDIPLSEQVYRTQALSGEWVERRIEHALVTGKSWRELAVDVRKFIHPNTPGGASYAAKRLARTELNNAFHATQVRQAVEDPYVVGMKWEVSGSHPKPDECDDYARGGDKGDGVYEPRKVPAKPHPQCLCYVVPEPMPRAEFLRSLAASL